MQVKPMKTYAAPTFPTRVEADVYPELLRQLPKRWQGNAVLLAVLAGAGLATLGVGAAQGAEKAKIAARLAPIFTSADDRPQIAGRVATPPVLTEAEARAIILDEAKKAGLAFAPDALAVDKVRLPQPGQTPGDAPKIDLTLDGADAKRKIQYEYVSQADTQAWAKVNPKVCSDDTTSTATALREGLSQKLPEGTTVIFYDAGGLDAQDGLRAQVRGFIAWLKAEGVI
jgi:hypothetical protein